MSLWSQLIATMRFSCIQKINHDYDKASNPAITSFESYVNFTQGEDGTQLTDEEFSFDKTHAWEQLRPFNILDEGCDKECKCFLERILKYVIKLHNIIKAISETDIGHNAPILKHFFDEPIADSVRIDVLIKFVKACSNFIQLFLLLSEKLGSTDLQVQKLTDFRDFLKVLYARRKQEVRVEVVDNLSAIDKKKVNGICVFDIDGTLTTGKRRRDETGVDTELEPPGAIDAINECRRMGMGLAYNTARPGRSLKRVSRKITELMTFYEAKHCFRLSGNVENAKLECLDQLMHKFNVKGDKKSVILIDDEESNVKNVSSEYSTLHVNQAGGINSSHVKLLRELISNIKSTQ